MLNAVDIVLLPDEIATGAFVAWNALLREHGDGAVRLAPEERPGYGLPHLSLCMGVLDEERIPALVDALAPLARGVSEAPLGLHLSRHGGNLVTSLRFAAAGVLGDRHRGVMRAACPLLDETPATAEMFAECDVDAPLEASADWVTDYTRQAAFDRFDPHLTLGYGDTGLLADVKIPSIVRFDALALFQLGASCTCRRALWRSDA